MLFLIFCTTRGEVELGDHYIFYTNEIFSKHYTSDYSRSQHNWPRFLKEGETLMEWQIKLSLFSSSPMNAFRVMPGNVLTLQIFTANRRCKKHACSYSEIMALSSVLIMLHKQVIWTSPVHLAECLTLPVTISSQQLYILTQTWQGPSHYY